jgi:catechol 2,3-dioxygenase-like lactoylglutathione lyase family enzyme
MFVRDLERMAAFYRDVLGFAPIADERSDVWAPFDTGGTRLGLHAIPREIAYEGDTPSPLRPREDGPIRLDFLVADVEREVERLESLGVTVLRKPWGACHVVDPEGNVFGLSSV